MEETSTASLKTRLLISLAILLTLGLTVVLADLGSLPEFLYGVYDFPMGDKVGHFVLMGLLAAALNLILPGRSVRGVSLPLRLGSLVAIVLITVEEFSQIGFVYRSFSLIDLGFSYLGVLFADLGPGWWQRPRAANRGQLPKSGGQSEKLL